MSRERPSHECFVVEEREEGKKAYWTRIGSAWPHKDGKGFNLQLSALPANGDRLVLRELAKPDRDEETQDSGRTRTEDRLSELTRVASAAPGEPELQLAEQVLRTGVRDALARVRKGRRKNSGAV
jgi:hypothetical protein